MEGERGREGGREGMRQEFGYVWIPTQIREIM